MADSTNNNVFDIDTDSIDATSLATDAFGATTTAGAEQAGSDVFASVNLTNMTPVDYNASTLATADVASYVPYEATGVDYNVANNQTAQGQLEGIIAANSPLMQQAENRALRQMNDRGLLNSSIAQQAGQAALYDYALPIAQTDADIYSRAAMFNADTANRMELANQAAKNRAYEFGAAMQQEGGLANMAALNDASQFNLGLKTDFYKYIFGEGLDFEMFNAEKRQEVNLAAAKEANATTRQLIENSFKARVAEADAQTKLKLQEIDSVTKAELASVESDYKQLMQSTSSASDLYQQTMANIASYTDNPDLDAVALETIINREVDTLRTGLILIDAFNPVVTDITQLLDFTGISTEDTATET